MFKFSFETDNPSLEKKFEKLMTMLLAGVGIEDKPIVLPPLDLPKIKEPLIEPPIVFELEEPPKQQSEKKQYTRSTEQTCEEGFPLSWKQKIKDRISARTAFFVKDIYGDSKTANHVSAVRNYIQSLDGVIYERLHSVKGSPLLVIPTWEDRGVTKFAKNAYELQSRLVRIANNPALISEMGLSEPEIKQLQDLGVEIELEV